MVRRSSEPGLLSRLSRRRPNSLPKPHSGLPANRRPSQHLPKPARLPRRPLRLSRICEARLSIACTSSASSSNERSHEPPNEHSQRRNGFLSYISKQVWPPRIDYFSHHSPISPPCPKNFT